jgi:hypothetical protein
VYAVIGDDATVDELKIEFGHKLDLQLFCQSTSLLEAAAAQKECGSGLEHQLSRTDYFSEIAIRRSSRRL